PEFEETKARGDIVKNPLATVVRRDWRNILRVIALRVVESCAYYLTATYLLSYITDRNEDDRGIALAGVVIASFVAVLVTVSAGALTDRVGRRPIYLIGCALVIVYGIPMFLMANSGQPALMVLLFLIGIGIIHASLTGTQAAWFAELFATNTRSSGASVGYQFAAAIAGFAPFIAALLATEFGWAGPAGFYIAAGCVGLCGVLLTQETWGPDQRAEVEAYVGTAAVGAAKV
ncbi:MAG: MFS transporter, partial [Actinomadura sp.]